LVGRRQADWPLRDRQRAAVRRQPRYLGRQDGRPPADQPVDWPQAETEPVATRLGRRQCSGEEQDWELV